MLLFLSHLFSKRMWQKSCKRGYGRALSFFSRLPFVERESSTSRIVYMCMGGYVCNHFWSKAKQNIYCHISFISQPVAVKFCTLLLLIQSNKVYDTTPNLNLSKSQIISISNNLNYFKSIDLSQFSTNFVKTLDSTSQDQS